MNLRESKGDSIWLGEEREGEIILISSSKNLKVIKHHLVFFMFEILLWATFKNIPSHMLSCGLDMSVSIAFMPY